jgi:lipopolysaccharide heptosyltransferase II
VTLVILPKWLGELVMSAGLLSALDARRPRTAIHVAVPAHLADLAGLLPGVDAVHAHTPDTCRGPLGALRLGRALGRRVRYDTCYCLPRSFRTAIIAYGTGATERVGYRQECRSFLLTRAERRVPGVHRAIELARLAPSSSPTPSVHVHLARPPASAVQALVEGCERPAVAINLHSEAQARRMSLDKWARIAGAIAPGLARTIVLVGSVHDVARTEAFLERLPPTIRVANVCGRTTAGQLAGVLAACDVVLSSDSGPAHLANAIGVPTVVLFGAGDERTTVPFNPAGRHVLRLEGLPCAPCVQNRCRLGRPVCLDDLDESAVVGAVAAAIGART